MAKVTDDGAPVAVAGGHSAPVAVWAAAAAGKNPVAATGMDSASVKARDGTPAAAPGEPDTDVAGAATDTDSDGIAA